MTLTSARMEHTIRRYFDGCNEADAEKMRGCFLPDAVHYFPPGMYLGPFQGADTIASRWQQAVATLGSVWTIDNLVADPRSAQAVIEWTHFKTRRNQILRGDEWYLFDRATGLIREIRAYYAAPQPEGSARNELGGFDYAARGYPLEAPARWPRPQSDSP